MEAERKPDDQPPMEEDWTDTVRWLALGAVGEALRRAIRSPIGVWGTRGPPKVGHLTKPPQAADPPAPKPKIRPTVDPPVEWTKNQAPNIRPVAIVVRATFEVSEDADLVELSHAAYGWWDRPESCTLALVNVQVILPDGPKMRTKKKLQTGKIEANFVYQTWDNRYLSIDLKVGRGQPIHDFGQDCKTLVEKKSNPPMNIWLASKAEQQSYHG
jgi:hypothetical protein